jgi:hypothetical protein
LSSRGLPPVHPIAWRAAAVQMERPGLDPLARLERYLKPPR